jgi:hypothetical protein
MITLFLFWYWLQENANGRIKCSSAQQSRRVLASKISCKQVAYVTKQAIYVSLLGHNFRIIWIVKLVEMILKFQLLCGIFK